MMILVVSATRQVVLPSNLLRHLGVWPGQNIEVSKLPGGRIEMRGARPAETHTTRPTGTIDDFIGLPARKATRTVSIDEMNGWDSELPKAD